MAFLNFWSSTGVPPPAVPCTAQRVSASQPGHGHVRSASDRRLERDQIATHPSHIVTHPPPSADDRPNSRSHPSGRSPLPSSHSTYTDHMSFPGLSPTLAAAAAARRAEREKEVEAVRRRVRQTMPPVPELRFEVAYLKSILPGLSPRRRAVIKEEKDGSMRYDKPSAQETATALYNAEPVVVDWGRVVAVTIKDQVSARASGASEWKLWRLLSGRLWWYLVHGGLALQTGL